MALAFAWSCRNAPPPPPLVAQVSGSIELPGLSSTVRVVRDRWGVPHIYADSAADLFTAQGFVQAQDRLFQMDLWRRRALGRLAEVLGPNFIERDAMTRRVQYHGDPEADWASHGPDTKAIATAFTRGINAWVSRARERPPEEFLLAGWKPDYWSAADLLNRTDAFLECGNLVEEARRAQVSDVVVDALRRAGTPPFFVALAVPIRAPTGSDSRTSARFPARWGAEGATPSELSPYSGSRAAATRERMELGEAGARFDNPSRRYLVHLSAPGWHVAGATAPWLPGVAVGHNERVAWAMIPIGVSTGDVYLRPTDRSAARIIREPIPVKGRASPFEFDSELTPYGVVVASDREHDRAFSVRWSGMEAGTAAGLGALALDRARNWREFREALAGWKMPPRRVVYGDIDGNLALQDAVLASRRTGRKWSGWLTLDDLPHRVNPSQGIVDAGPAGLPARSNARRAPDEPAVYSHVLGVTAAARRRFTIGPLDRPRDDDSPLRLTFDLRDWDRSRILNAPGQSESADSHHFNDHASLWSAGQTAPFPFSDAAVGASAETTLILAPSPQRTR